MSGKYILQLLSHEKSHCFNSNTAELHTYMKEFMMSRAKDKDIDLLLQYYPDDQSAGSPFDTGIDNEFSAFSCTSRQLIETEVVH